MKPFIFITREIPKEGLELLKDIGDVEVYRGDEAVPRELLKEKVKNASALLTLLNDKIDAEILNIAQNLKVIANYAVGYDNIDIERATQLGILVTNTPDVLTEATAELTIALMLSITRRLKEGFQLLERGEFKGWHPLLLLGIELKGKKLGIIGMGRIGRRVAEIAKSGFGMKILYYSRKREREVEENLGAQYMELDEMLPQIDILSIHVPLTSETRNLLSRKRLSKMKKGAYIINTSRGDVLDEEALIELLEQGKIGGAALDVFKGEPEIDKRLLKFPNVIVTPHIGSATNEARIMMARLAAKSIVDTLSGKIPENLVNKEVLNAPNLRI